MADMDVGMTVGLIKALGSPDPAVIEGAVSDWLDDHPEATTTVEDGAISYAKLNASLQGTVDDVSSLKTSIDNKIAIFEPETGYRHENVVKFTMNGNTYAFGNARYADKKNLIVGYNVSETVKSVAITSYGNIVSLNGTNTSGSSADKYIWNLNVDMPAGSYTFKIEPYAGESTLPNSKNMYLEIWYDGNETSTYSKRVSLNINSTAQSSTFTTTDHAYKISVSVGIARDGAYSDFRLFYTLFPSNVTITDTGETIGSTGTLSITPASKMSVLDTMMHTSTVDVVADTKDYIDNHMPNIIGFWTDNIYALPEDFGAKGDGVADDTIALVNCIAYSASSGKPVRAYGKYKTTSTLLISSRLQDVYIRYLVYAGNGAAVQLSNYFVTFAFDTIESSGIGILFEKYGTQDCSYHVVNGNRIFSTADCIKASPTTYYNTVNVRYLKSTDSNCITFSYTTNGIDQPSEYVFRDCTCICAGWAGYNLWGTKCYNFTLEGNCKNGFYNPINCSFFGCRHRELTDSVALRVLDGMINRDNGPLFKYTINPTYHGTHGMKYITADFVPWYSIDVSEIQGYNSIEYVDADSVDEWTALSYNGQDVGISIHGMNKDVHRVYGERMYFIGGNKVFEPTCRTTFVFKQAEYDMTLFESQTDADILAAYNQGGWGTDFITGYSHTDYYMNASFGAVGYNDLTVTQQDGNTCTIYDKLGNVLFDGTNEGNGKWHLSCVIDSTSDGRLKNRPADAPSAGWWGYDGTNETWTVSKISG